MKNLNETLESLLAFKAVMSTTYQELEPAYKNVIEAHEGFDALFKDKNDMEGIQHFEELFSSLKHVVYTDFSDLDSFISSKINILEAYLEL